MIKWALSPKKKGKCGRTRKASTKEVTGLLRESKNDPRKISSALRKDLASAEADISASAVRRRLTECGRPARRQLKKQLLTTAMKRKDLHRAKNTESRLLLSGEKFSSATRVIFLFMDNVFSMSIN